MSSSFAKIKVEIFVLIYSRDVLVVGESKRACFRVGDFHEFYFGILNTEAAFSSCRDTHFVGLIVQDKGNQCPGGNFHAHDAHVDLCIP